MLNFINIPEIEGFPFIEQSFDSPTLYGLVCKIANQLNETIKQVNSNTEFIENLDIDLDEINNRIDQLSNEFSALLVEFEQFKTDVNNTINSRFIDLRNQLISLMNDYKAVFDADLQEAIAEVNARIDSIILGNIEVYNPTTGSYENINKVITDIYDAVRYDAITCTEFDALELTATTYDSKDITAYNFDNNGKSILLS